MLSCQFEANSAEEAAATADIKCRSSGGWVEEVGGVARYHMFVIDAHNKHDRVPEKIPTRLWFNLVFFQLPGRVPFLIFAFECVTFAFTALLPAFCHDASPLSLPHPFNSLFLLFLFYKSCCLFSNFKLQNNLK